MPNPDDDDDPRIGDALWLIVRRTEQQERAEGRGPTSPERWCPKVLAEKRLAYGAQLRTLARANPGMTSVDLAHTVAGMSRYALEAIAEEIAGAVADAIQVIVDQETRP